MIPAVFELRQWSVRRGQTFHAGPVNLRLWPGQVAAIMGPSGVGKTTLCLTALGYADRGMEVRGTRRYRGIELSDRAIPAHSLYVPQGLPFNPNFELEAFLLHLPWMRNFTRRARRYRIRRVLGGLGLEHRRHAVVAELSGGEAQRAALAAVQLVKPLLLVADEPVSGLDPGMAWEVLAAFRRSVLRCGGAGVFSLHSVDGATLVSDQIVVLFPHAMSSPPIIVYRGDPGWRKDWLHAALCVSRWLADAASSPAAAALPTVLQGGFRTGTLVNGPRGIHVVTRDGDMRIATASEAGRLRAALREMPDANEVAPVLLTGDGLSLIGVATASDSVSSSAQDGLCAVLAEVSSKTS